MAFVPDKDQNPGFVPDAPASSGFVPDAVNQAPVYLQSFGGEGPPTENIAQAVSDYQRSRRPFVRPPEPTAIEAFGKAVSPHGLGQFIPGEPMMGTPAATAARVGQFAGDIAHYGAVGAGAIVGEALAGPLGGAAAGSAVGAGYKAAEVPLAQRDAVLAESFQDTFLPLAAMMLGGAGIAAAGYPGTALAAGAVVPLLPAISEHRLPTPEEVAFAGLPFALKGFEIARMAPEVGRAVLAVQDVKQGVIELQAAARSLEEAGLVKPEDVNAMVAASSHGLAAETDVHVAVLPEPAPALPPEAPPSGAEAGAAGLGPATLGAAPFIERNVIPAIKSLARAAKEAAVGLTHLLVPTAGVDPLALDAVMKTLGDRNKAEFVVDAGFKQAEKALSKLTNAENVAFIDRYKLGKPQPTPELAGVDKAMRLVDDATWRLADSLGFGPEFKADHYRVLWKVVPGQTAAQSRGTFGYRRPLAGSGGMLRRSTLATMSEGIAMGGEPVSYNPVTMFKLAQIDLQKFITAKRMWDWGKDNGFVKFVKRGGDRGDFVQVDDKIAKVYFPAKSGEGMVAAGEYWAEPGFGRIVNNFLSRNWFAETEAGRGLMNVKNMFTGVELSLSAFHAVFEGANAITGQAAVGLRRVVNVGLRGVGAENLKATLRGIGEIVTSPYAAVPGQVRVRRLGINAQAPGTMSYLGESALQYAANPAEFLKLSRGQSFIKAFPDAEKLIGDLFAGGGKLTMNSEYRLKALKGLREAAAQGDIWGAALRSPFAASEVVMRPLFEWYIPRLKVGMFLREYSLRLQEYAPELASGRLTRETLARKTYASVEDRFGEMNWDSQFWNRTMQGAAMLTFRSTTWKLGNLRLFLKTPYEQGAEIVRAVGQKRVPRPEPGTAVMASMMGFSAVLSSVVTKALTGKYPWEWADGKTVPGLMKNFVFPHYDAADDTKRLNTPTYLGNLVSLIRGPGKYLSSSLAGNWIKAWEVYQNRDFYNAEIYSPNDPIQRRALDGILHLMPVPIGVQSAMRLSKEGTDRKIQVLSLLGMTKAARYESMTPFEREVQAAYDRQPQFVKTREQAALAIERRAILEGVRTGARSRSDLLAFAKDKKLSPHARADLLRRAREDPRASAIKGLSLPDALAAWRVADAEERAVTAKALATKAYNYRANHGEDQFTAEARALGIIR